MPSPKLPRWVTAARTSDGYLVQLAAAAGLTLATFDAVRRVELGPVNAVEHADLTKSARGMLFHRA